jgi:multisubunit Na+/H+ antiporter MnhB subunit
MSEAILHGGLILLIIGVAAATVFTRDTFGAITAFIVYGLLLAVAWVTLGSIDVALTEAALGSGITGALLLRAASRLRRSEKAAEAKRAGPAAHGLAGLACAALTAALIAVVLALPNPAPTLAPRAMEALPATQVGNPVTGVLLAFRAWDTFLETVVLVLALVAIWGLTPDAKWGGRPGQVQLPEPDGVLTFLAKLLPPVGVLIALYLFWVGADQPGGKFQAGTLLAAMWLLAIQAGLIDAPLISRPRLRLAIVLGPLVFAGVGLLGLILSSGLFAYPPGFVKAFILLIEAASTVSIGVTLGLLVIGPPERPATP